MQPTVSFGSALFRASDVACWQGCEVAGTLRVPSAIVWIEFRDRLRHTECACYTHSEPRLLSGCEPAHPAF